MGRNRSDDSDSEHSRRAKKKKKRRGRSRSSTDSESSHISSSKSKKSKKKSSKFSHSRSRSTDRRHGAESRASRRSRSASTERYSHGKFSKRSRSPPPLRHRTRSRSPSPRRRRSRSNSRDQRSRSGSAHRVYKRRSRSLSRDRRSRSTDNQRLGRLSLSKQIPDYAQMSPAEQAEERMRLALKAAAAADEKLKGRCGGDSTVPVANSSAVQSLRESSRFADSVAAIQSDKFLQTSFKSSRSTKVQEEPQDSMPTHDDAIFGSLSVSGFTMTPDPDSKPVQLDPDSILHPSLYSDPEDKMDRWIERLIQLRRKKLEGEAM